MQIGLKNQLLWQCWGLYSHFYVCTFFVCRRENELMPRGAWGMRLEEQIYISFVRNVPFYKQIARYFRKKLADGTLGRLSRLPGSRRVAAALEVHYNTVLRAYRLLREDRLIRMYERKNAWAENTGGWWMVEASKKYARYDIKAALREALALGANETELKAWLKDVIDDQVFEAIRLHRQDLANGRRPPRRWAESS